MPRVALVTGGSGALGQAIVHRFLRDGDTVCVPYIVDTERARLVRAADEALGLVVAKLKKRGINHPYVKNYLLARTTPLTRARKTLPSFEQTFKKLRSNLEDFDVTKVRYDEIQRSAIMMAPAAAD